MLACHHSHALNHFKGSESQKMEEYSRDSMEKAALTGKYHSALKTVSNDVKTTKHVTFDLPSDEKKKRFDEVVDIGDAAETCPGVLKDLEAAKSAVVFMGFPQHLVQLVVDAGPLDPTYSFTNAGQLFLLVSDLATNPKTQEDLQMKLYQHQQESEASPVSRGNTKASAENNVLGNNTKTPAENPDDVLGNASSVKHDCHSLPAGMLEDKCQSSMASSSSDNPTSLPEDQSADASKCQQNVAESSGAVKDSTLLLAAEEKYASPDTEKTSSLPEAAKEKSSSPKEKTSETSQVVSFTAARAEATPTHGSAADRSPREELKDRVKQLAAENWKLTQRKRCRACRKVDLSSDGVTFLPCGHFITCETCSEMFDDCPACGKSILGTVKTFLS